jgi:GNAT superfamily N-acetyltransferase
MRNDPQVHPATTLRPMHASDLVALNRLVQQVSWPHRPQDCAQMFELGAGIAAIDATGVMAGIGMRWSFGRDAGTIGMILVAPEKQGRGVGRSLMTALIAGSGSRALMLNATSEGLRLYEKLGFVATGLVRQHQARPGGRLALLPAPAVALRRAVPADRAALCAIDAAAFGADRSVLVERHHPSHRFCHPACLRPRHDNRPGCCAERRRGHRPGSGRRQGRTARHPARRCPDICRASRVLANGGGLAGDRHCYNYATRQLAGDTKRALSVRPRPSGDGVIVAHLWGMAPWTSWSVEPSP